ncbi:GyrI-like domain-containing protein [Rickettsia endosymbiont of Cantharis rufa]|uniref:GyrI-like domain-containing protein n=1 Tax=Rickettsia endosymbiont of Cantharis rufa TaxID=3066248 RepID=UPI0031332977
MDKVIIQLSEIKLVGITARTSNTAEMNADTTKIGATMHRFFADKLQDKILNRKTPEKVFVVYTNYESDATGEYTYFGRTSILQMWILKGYTFNKSSDDFIMNIQ